MVHGQTLDRRKELADFNTFYKAILCSNVFLLYVLLLHISCTALEDTEAVNRVVEINKLVVL